MSQGMVFQSKEKKIDLIRPSKDKTINVAPQGSRLKEDDSTGWQGFREGVRGCQAKAGRQEVLQDRITAHWQAQP